jgi:hypothetical protein
MSRDFDRFPVPALVDVASRVGRHPYAVVYLAEDPGKLVVVPTTASTTGLYVEFKTDCGTSLECAPRSVGEERLGGPVTFQGRPRLWLRENNRLAGLQGIRRQECPLVRGEFRTGVN